MNPHSVSPASRNSAILYYPESYDTGRPKLMGRHAAGEGFLNGFIQHSGVATLYCFASDKHHAEELADRVRANGRDTPVRWIPTSRPQQLAEAGCLFVPGPNLLDSLAWRRRRTGQLAFSLTGVTHTIASHDSIDAIAGMLLAPLQPWDALICTSNAIRTAVRRLLEKQADYLRERLGANRIVLPQLPVIPLGVDSAALAPDADARGRWRQQLGVGADDVVVLFVGRLSYHAKAHPLPMYLGLEAAAQRTGRRVHLVQSGWFANEPIAKAFAQAAATLCPSVNVITLDGRRPEVRREIWSAADIFTSLADNIQETFGLTPVEAMAAGLPVVVSDWDGYRDTVRDGIDGIRVPTLSPPPNSGTDLADRYADGIDSYDRHCAYASGFAAVDTAAAVEAYVRLIEDDGLRRRLGDAGQRRAREHYDWRLIVARYQDLWQELAELRAGGTAGPVNSGPWSRPTRPDPFAMFDGWASMALTLEHVVALAPGIDAAAISRRRNLQMVSYMGPVLPPARYFDQVLKQLQTAGTATVGDIIAAIPENDRASVARALAWLCKLDIVRLLPRKTP